jgi:hypothetical protein
MASMNFWAKLAGCRHGPATFERSLATGRTNSKVVRNSKTTQSSDPVKSAGDSLNSPKRWFIHTTSVNIAKCETAHKAKSYQTKAPRCGYHPVRICDFLNVTKWCQFITALDLHGRTHDTRLSEIDETTTADASHDSFPSFECCRICHPPGRRTSPK